MKLESRKKDKKSRFHETGELKRRKKRKPKVSYFKLALKKELLKDQVIGSRGKPKERMGAFELSLFTIHSFLKCNLSHPKLHQLSSIECPKFRARYDPAKPLLVLDMDETLVHTEFTYDETNFDVEIRDQDGASYFVSLLPDPSSMST